MKNILWFFLWAISINLNGQDISFDENDQFSVKHVYFFSPTFPMTEGWIDIYQDDGTKYSNSNNYSEAYTYYGQSTKPVGYVSNNVMKVGADLDITLCNSENSLEDLIIKGVASNGFNFPPQSGTLINDLVRYKMHESEEILEDEMVQYFEEFKIKWFITFDQDALDPNLEESVEWALAGESKNQIYVTHDDPILTHAPKHTEITKPYHTVLHIGCNNANDENSDEAIVENIYKEFEDQKVYREDGSGPMSYWGFSNPLTGNECRSVGGLIEELDAACGEWAQFMNDIIRIQGIDGGKVVTVHWNYWLNDFDKNRMTEEMEAFFGAEFSNVQADLFFHQGILKGFYSGFLVKEWNSLSNSEDFVMDELYNTFALVPISNITLQNGNVIPVKEQEGAKAQGNDDPRSEFENHAILEYNNNLYDPSYGTSKKNSPLSWETASLSAFGSRLSYQKEIGGIPINYKINWVGHLNATGVLQATYN